MHRVTVDPEEFAQAGPSQQRKIREYAKVLQSYPFRGDRIRRSQIPRRFRPFRNLFRISLPEGWRALYTVVTDASFGNEIRFVWIGDHKRYDRLFGDR